jgi:CheY-like chemotaxis protein
MKDMIGINKKKILIVEDEQILALMEKTNLEKYGYEVITIESGEKAIQLIESSSNIDLILI